MTTSEMLEQIQALLAADSGLALLSKNNTTRGHIVTLGTHADESAFAAVQIVIYDCTLAEGNVLPRKTWIVNFGINVPGEPEPTSNSVSVPTESGTVAVATRTYEGFLMAQDVRDKCLEALFGTTLGKIEQVKSESESWQDQFLCQFSLRITQLNGR